MTARRCTECPNLNRFHRKLCPSCHSKKMRKKNPVRYAYDTLKSNSKRRGKEFTLTFEEFSQFCHATDYIQGKGVTKDSYSIDRIDNSRGYTIDNIQILTVSENRKKGRKELRFNRPLYAMEKIFDGRVVTVE